MENFTEIKAEIRKRAAAAKSCREGFQSGLAAENIEELLQVINHNFKFCVGNKIWNKELMEMIGLDICSQNELYLNVSTDKGCLLVDSGTVEVSGTATVIATGTATVIATGTAKVRALDSVTVTVNDLAVLIPII